MIFDQIKLTNYFLGFPPKIYYNVGKKIIIIRWIVCGFSLIRKITEGNCRIKGSDSKAAINFLHAVCLGLEE